MPGGRAVERLEGRAKRRARGRATGTHRGTFRGDALRNVKIRGPCSGQPCQIPPWMAKTPNMIDPRTREGI
eukprot:8385213-Pyramimonas_sp.AAC.1